MEYQTHKQQPPEDATVEQLVQYNLLQNCWVWFKPIIQNIIQEVKDALAKHLPASRNTQTVSYGYGQDSGSEECQKGPKLQRKKIKIRKKIKQLQKVKKELKVEHKRQYLEALDSDDEGWYYLQCLHPRLDTATIALTYYKTDEIV
ncbi:hypothetical protein BDZ91DRAFT_769089 [Kalaharituber pfeilii]|nr:hypothetical protein BDZ91DRAFT_769089 [Kalaharituber pfeilii]